jgi:hypothetical protein
MITLVDLCLAYGAVIGTSMAIKKFRERGEVDSSEQPENAAPAGSRAVLSNRNPTGTDRVAPTFDQSPAAEAHDAAHAREMRSIPDAPDDEDMILIGNDPYRDD